MYIYLRTHNIILKIPPKITEKNNNNKGRTKSITPQNTNQKQDQHASKSSD